MADTQTTIKTHRIPSGGITKQPGIQIHTILYEGDYQELEKIAKDCVVGRKVPSFTGSTPDEWPTSESPINIVAAAELSRLKGCRGRLSLTYTTLETCEVWGLEMVEIQKPIKTWMADASDGEKPDLNLLANWEAQATNQALQTEYNAYKYNGQELTGNTLTLAKMIREDGVEYYVIYTPIITLTERLNEIPNDIGAATGQIGAPTSGEGVDISKLTGRATQWLKTADRLTGALDGTYTRVQQWTGADVWNPNLYKATKES